MTYSFTTTSPQLLNSLIWLPPLIGLFISFVFFFLIWTIFWKGLALWKAANNQQKGWFIALLIINTLGILEIVYLLAFQKPTSQPKKPQSK